jgi:hypothetical protein
MFIVTKGPTTPAAVLPLLAFTCDTDMSASTAALATDSWPDGWGAAKMPTASALHARPVAPTRSNATSANTRCSRVTVCASSNCRPSLVCASMSCKVTGLGASPWSRFTSASMVTTSWETLAA